MADCHSLIMVFDVEKVGDKKLGRNRTLNAIYLMWFEQIESLKHFSVIAMHIYVKNVNR